jgi:adenosylhomocysteine nucleosidase
LLLDGCNALMSFGLAGGLAPHLNSGDLILAVSVVAEDGVVYETDSVWLENALSLIGDEVSVIKASIAGRDRPVLTADEKAELYHDVSAVAVDMESHAVARVAAENGVPFLALRVIIDTAARDIPSWAVGLVGDDGKVRNMAVLVGVLSHLWQIPLLIEIGKDNKKALSTLCRVALLAGRRFGLA